MKIKKDHNGGLGISIYIRAEDKAIMTEYIECLQKMKNKKLIVCESQEIVKALKKLHKENKSDNYYDRKAMKMDSYINPQQEERNEDDLRDYSCIPRMHEFHIKGICGETNLRKLVNNNNIIDKVTVKNLIQMRKNCEWFVDQISCNRSIREFFDKLEQAPLTKEQQEEERRKKEESKKIAEESKNLRVKCNDCGEVEYYYYIEDDETQTEDKDIDKTEGGYQI